MTSSYDTWLAGLLRYLQMPASSSAPTHPVSKFVFDGKPPVYVRGRGGQIEMMSQAGVLTPPYQAETLLALLERNRGMGAGPGVSVTVARASGAVLVWTRQPQATLDAAGAARLLGAVRQQVDAVGAVLGGPKQSSAGGSRVLERMLRMGQTMGR